MIVILPYQLHFINEYQYKWPRTWHGDGLLINYTVFLLWLQSNLTLFYFISLLFWILHSLSCTGKETFVWETKINWLILVVTHLHNPHFHQISTNKSNCVCGLPCPAGHMNTTVNLVRTVWGVLQGALKYAGWNLGHLEITESFDNKVSQVGISSLISALPAITITCNIHPFKDSV